jgi:hypothetical protein
LLLCPKVAFSPLLAAYGMNWVLLMCAGVCLTGALVTHIFTGSEPGKDGKAYPEASKV